MSLGFFLVKSNFWIFRSRSLGRFRAVAITVYSVPFSKVPRISFWSSSSCNLSNRCSCISARRMP